MYHVLRQFSLVSAANVDSSMVPLSNTFAIVSQTSNNIVSSIHGESALFPIKDSRDNNSQMIDSVLSVTNS